MPPKRKGPPPGQDPKNPANIRAKYGFVAEMAKSIPELRGILGRATKEQWTTDRFLMAVANTKWWKSNNAAVREWQTLESTDPATARTRKAHIKGDIWTRAQALGIDMNDAQQNQAFWFVQFSGGMSEENIDAYLGRTFFNAHNVPWNKLHGAAAEHAQELDSLRQAYRMPDSKGDKWTRDMLNTIMAGKQTVEGAGIVAKSYAHSRYGQFSERLEAGETMTDIARPYMDAAGELLESNVDIWDELMNKALEARDDQGQPKVMTTWELEQETRKDQRWGKTNNAHDRMAEVVNQIGEDWGFK